MHTVIKANVLRSQDRLVKSGDRTSKLIEQFQDLSTKEKENLASLNHPVRPGYGTKGNVVTLWTNHFPVQNDNSVTLYKYVLDVQPLSKEEDKKSASSGRPRGINGKKKRRIIFLYIEEGPIVSHTIPSLDGAAWAPSNTSIEHVEARTNMCCCQPVKMRLRLERRNSLTCNKQATMKDAVASDFDTILITREALTDKQMAAYSVAYRNDLEETPPANPQMYSVTLSNPTTLPMRELGDYMDKANSRYGSEAYGLYKQALEIIFGYRVKAERDDITSTIGRKHHAVDDSRIESVYLGNALEAVRGYMASIRFSAGGLLLNVQIKHAACYSRDLNSGNKTSMLLSDSMNDSGVVNWSRPGGPDWAAVSRFYRGVQIQVCRCNLHSMFEDCAVDEHTSLSFFLAQRT